MIRRPVTIQLKNGLETRPVAKLVQVASRFDSEIHLESGRRKVNAKSIMGMMTLGLGNGDDVLISAEGEDELEAVNSIESYLSGMTIG